MSTNSSSQVIHKNLASEIMAEFGKISEEFSSFQNHQSLACPPGCGKCCFKSDIYCTPVELLPMALALLESGEASSTLEKCHDHHEDRCMFMNITDEKNGKGRCTQYEYRPLVCRTFGVAGRHDKNGAINFSVCTTLKDTRTENYQKLVKHQWSDKEVPFIDQSKNKLSNLDPKFLEEEFPINQALALMLEKVLFYESFNTLQSNT